jgi:hypothetical protein
MRLEGQVAFWRGKRKGVYKVSVGKPAGKRPLGRPKRRWEDKYYGSSGSGMSGFGLIRLRTGTGDGHL